MNRARDVRSATPAPLAAIGAAFLTACGGSPYPAVHGEATDAGTVAVFPQSGAPLDRTATLPADPLGLAAAGDTLLVGNRADPWGFLRLVPQGGGVFRAEKIAMVEQEYGQRMGFASVAWNGEAWVALTDGAWLGRSGMSFFTVHDAEDLRMLDAFPAPPQLGCLAWDGRNLWLADAFSDLLYVLDVGGTEPTVTRTVDPGVSYLPGVAYYGGGIWVVEYGSHGLGPASSPGVGMCVR